MNQNMGLAIILFVAFALIVSMVQSQSIREAEAEVWIAEAPGNVWAQAVAGRMFSLSIGVAALSGAAFLAGNVAIVLRNRWQYPTIDRNKPTVTKNWIYDPLTGAALKVGTIALPNVTQAEALQVAMDRGQWVKLGYAALEALRELPQENLNQRALEVLHDVDERL